MLMFCATECSKIMARVHATICIVGQRWTWRDRKMGKATLETRNVAEPLLGSDFLTADALARELGVSPRTIARWHVGRTGQPRVCLGKKIIFRPGKRDRLVGRA